MKQIRKLFFAAVGVLLPAMAAADTLPVIQNVNAYESLSLNGEWNYIVDVQEEGYYDYRMNPTPWGFFRNAKPQKPEDLIEYDFDKSPTMQIPGDWNTQDERLFFYEGTVWFKKSWNLPPAPSQGGGVRYLLYFGAVNYDCRVWVNGKEAGHHVGGFTPFNYDVTEMLKEGENTVIVKVDNKRHAEDVPTLIFDWWNYGGITRDVKLVKVTPVYIEDYHVQMVSLEGRRLAFSARLSKAEAGHTVTFDIPELKLKKAVTTDADGRVQMFAKFKPQLWSPENPKLYQVNISLDNATTITDEIGFRTIETRDKQILLNGQPIFLKGISIHDEKPNGGGRANSTEDARQLLTWAKELGCNFVRLAHYPHHEYMVREAERMGILVWSANETPHSAERDDFLGRLAQYARTQDSTRLISMAMEVTGAANYVNRLNDNMNKYVDVVSFNQYIGWYRDVNDAPKMTWEIPYNKPVIISEFGGGAKSGYHGAKNQRWTEEFQENLYRENIAMIEKIDGLSGTTPWILKDFRSPRRVLPGIQDFYNRKGLVSDKGTKKKAFFVLKQWYDSK